LLILRKRWKPKLNVKPKKRQERKLLRHKLLR
jgi:hypothetical protein